MDHSAAGSAVSELECRGRVAGTLQHFTRIGFVPHRADVAHLARRTWKRLEAQGLKLGARSATAAKHARSSGVRYQLGFARREVERGCADRKQTATGGRRGRGDQIALGREVMQK